MPLVVLVALIEDKVPYLIREMPMTMSRGPHAVNLLMGLMAGMVSRIEMSRKYTLANLLN